MLEGVPQGGPGVLPQRGQGISEWRFGGGAEGSLLGDPGLPQAAAACAGVLAAAILCALFGLGTRDYGRPQPIFWGAVAIALAAATALQTL